MCPSSILASSDAVPRWDVVVLTARNEAQKRVFELELARLRLAEQNLCARTIVLADKPENRKIGSGGATLNALVHLHDQFGGEQVFAQSRVLLLHSGGFSQRIFHVALIGKAFMLMPDGRSLLEHKLLSYVPLLRALSAQLSGGFVFIASADVLEHFPDACLSLSAEQAGAQLLLIAHQSQMEVAEQHGVYVLEGDGKEKRLKRVLQKPNRELIRQSGAVLPGAPEMALTDSCFMVGAELALELVRLKREMGWNEVCEELCCYRDFLCPLGEGPQEERRIHLKREDLTLLKWQTAVWELMQRRSVQVLDLGPESFFHFGTPSEFLAHLLDPKSAFREKFLPKEGCRNVVKSIAHCPEKISTDSFVEWSNLSDKCEVAEGCILSGLTYDEGAEEPIRIGPDMCVSTFSLDHGGEGPAYATVAFRRDDDLKGPSGGWFGHQLQGNGGHSLWDTPLFPVHSSAAASVLATLQLVRNGPQLEEGPLSIAQILSRANATAMLKARAELDSHLDERVVPI